MQTHFTPAQLDDPQLSAANSILRACVHCGFCIATCPTYVLTGDELDSPRGRIYLIRDLLERDTAPAANTVKHIDRCLSCLGCLTTCPSGVDYMHLVDQARRRIEETFRRGLMDRALRALLAAVLPDPGRLRLALMAAAPVRFLAAIMPARLAALLLLAPPRPPRRWADDGKHIYPALGPRSRRVALLAGCVQRTLAPRINAATVRLLTRHGCEVVVPEGSGCCGALVHHLGPEAAALDDVRANVAAWWREIEGEGLDAIVVNASGCGVMVKDYGYLLRGDAEMAGRAARVSELACDISELAAELELMNPAEGAGLTVAYQSACALQHGQGLANQPQLLLAAAGFEVREPAEAHLCCGSAGSYNILQPAFARQLGRRKADRIEALNPDVIASGNIGCMMQIGTVTGIPVVHTVELLDWATGGERPEALAGPRA